MGRTCKSTVCKDKGGKQEFELVTPKDWNVAKIRIDGEKISDMTVEKCDFALLAECEKKEKQAIFYVELKGCDLRKAISQLESTISILSSEYTGYKQRHARAVCSRIIPAMSSESQVAVARFQKKYGFLLRWHSGKGVHEISSK